MIINSNELYQLQQLCDSGHKITFTRQTSGEADLTTGVLANHWAFMLIYEWRFRHPLHCPECKALAGHSGSGFLAGGLG